MTCIRTIAVVILILVATTVELVAAHPPRADVCAAITYVCRAGARSPAP